MLIKCLALYQISEYACHDSLQYKINSLEMGHQWNTNVTKLSSDISEGQYRLYALHNLQYKRHDSFTKFFLLLSGDIELNPGPVKNPSVIYTGSVS